MRRRVVAPCSSPYHRDMSTVNRALTVGEFGALPAGDAGRHELVEGLVIREPRPGFSHGAAQVRIAAILHAFVTERRLGRVVSETGFVLARDPDTVRGPDIAFVSRQRLSALDGLDGFPEGAPDLAIEIRSPHDSPGELRAKVADYLAAGSRQVWVVDTERRTVVVYAALLSPRTLHETDVLEGADFLPGFRIAVGELLGDGGALR
jgi:Uma2 family endonuclease